jgi:hypothetical protein
MKEVRDSKLRRCVECGIVAPETNTAHTLISQAHGWRVTRTPAPDGSMAVQWRCADCWKRHKAARPGG